MTTPTPQTPPMAPDSPDGQPERGPRTIATRSAPAAVTAYLEQIEGQP